jgi:hypothetical protein
MTLRQRIRTSRASELGIRHRTQNTRTTRTTTSRATQATQQRIKTTQRVMLRAPLRQARVVEGRMNRRLDSTRLQAPAMAAHQERLRVGKAELTVRRARAVVPAQRTPLQATMDRPQAQAGRITPVVPAVLLAPQREAVKAARAHAQVARAYRFDSKPRSVRRTSRAVASTLVSAPRRRRSRLRTCGCSFKIWR